MGIVTFGGGLTMMPILQSELVTKRGWLTDEDIIDYYALSQGLPGIIAVNVAVFVGNTRRRPSGGIAAALGVVTPCIIIISVIAAFLSNFQDNIYVKHAFAGISVCVCALILNAVLNLGKKGIKDLLGVILCVSTFLLVEFTDISPVIVIVFAAAAGITYKFFVTKKDGGTGGADK